MPPVDLVYLINVQGDRDVGQCESLDVKQPGLIVTKAYLYELLVTNIRKISRPKLLHVSLSLHYILRPS